TMLILHASFLDDCLALWGEVPADGEPVTKPSRRKKAATSASIFDAGQDALTAALATVLPDLPGRSPQTEAVTAWLPTVDGRPIASSPLITEPPPPGAAASIQPWTVTALRLSSDAAAALLCACIGKEVLSPGLLAGKSLAFWEAGLRLAGAL